MRLLRSVRLAIVVGLVAGFMVAGGRDAGACSCVNRTFEQQLAASAIAFTGVARRVSPAGTLVSVTFDVDAVYKGSVPARTAVRTEGNSAACGVGFTVGKRYVVLALPDEASWTTNLCSGTTDAASVLAGRAPIATFDAPPDGSDGRSFPIGIAAGAFALVLAAAVWWWMLRSRPRPFV